MILYFLMGFSVSRPLCAAAFNLIVQKKGPELILYFLFNLKQAMLLISQIAVSVLNPVQL